VRLTDGSVIEGDLFIDASGPEGRLIRHVERDNFESWQEWLPCDRLMTASGPVLNPVPAFSQISAFREGWLGMYPLMNRTAMIAAYDSQCTTDEDVLLTMSALSGLRLEGDAVATAVSTGRRIEPWIGNCVAIGDTALMPDPLDAVDLHPLHTGISYLVSLIPVDRDDMPEARIYNAKMASHATGIRDFQISHYKLNRRFDEPFWDAVRDTDVPETLARKLRLFQARGIVRIEEDETFNEENWTSIFVGHNLMPKSWDPLVDRIPEQEQIANFQRVLKFIASEVEAMPSLQAHLELNAPSPASDYVF
jgi:tryptophan halogenase